MGHLKKSVFQVSFPLALFSEPRHASNPGRTGEEICNHVLNTTLPTFLSLFRDTRTFFLIKCQSISFKKTSPALTFMEKKLARIKEEPQIFYFH